MNIFHECNANIDFIYNIIYCGIYLWIHLRIMDTFELLNNKIKKTNLPT